MPLVIRETAGTLIRTVNDVEIIYEHIKHYAKETFHVLCLDSKNKLINMDMTGIGSLDAVLVHSREVFRTAITTDAVAIILVHNHPSGDPTPSSEDLRITKELVAAGRIININVLDHVIIGRNHSDQSVASFSMRDNGMVDF